MPIRSATRRPIRLRTAAATAVCTLAAVAAGPAGGDQAQAADAKEYPLRDCINISPNIVSSSR